MYYLYFKSDGLYAGTSQDEVDTDEIGSTEVAVSFDANWYTANWTGTEWALTDVIQPRYALLSFSEYFKLNRQLSELKGYKIGDKTEREEVMNPRAAKVNVEYDDEGNETGYEAKLVMLINSKLQEENPELIEGFELVRNYTPVDIPISSIQIAAIEQETMFWTIEHSIQLKINYEGLVIVFDSEDAVLISEELREMLVNECGITLILPE